MLKVLEQIDTRQQQQRSSPSPPTPTTVEHDTFGYAVPSKINSPTRTAEPSQPTTTAQQYAVVDVTQKKLSSGKNNKTESIRSNSSAPPHSLQSDESVKPDRGEPPHNKVIKPSGAPTVAEKNEEIEPYATVNIVVVDRPPKQQDTSKVRAPVHYNNNNVTRPGQSSSNGNCPVEPLNGVLPINHHSNIADEIIPYATVDLPKQSISKKHKYSNSGITITTTNNATKLSTLNTTL